MRCDLHCPTPSGGGITAGGVAALLGGAWLIGHAQAVSAAVSTLLVTVAIVAGSVLGLALAATVTVLAIRARQARAPLPPRARVYVRGEVVRDPERPAEPRSLAPGRRALPPASGQPAARVRPGSYTVGGRPVGRGR